MRRNKRKEFTGGHDFCLLPELGEMARVSRDQVVGSRGIGALEKYVVARIARDLEVAGRCNHVSAICDHLQ